MNLAKSYEYFQPESVDARIHIIGCGSVGSTLAENLVRMGLKNLTLWDFDVVEAHNIVNQMFVERQIGKPKVEALRDLLLEINPDLKDTIRLEPDGWRGKTLSGYIFLCVDNIELRREIAEKHKNNPNVRGFFDFRTGLEDAQHYGADWSIMSDREDFIGTMNFSHEEAKAETPVSACNVTLGVCPTVRVIVALGVANFVNFLRGRGLKHFISYDAFGYAGVAI